MAKKVKTAVDLTRGIFRSALTGALTIRTDDDYAQLSETPFADDKRAIRGDYGRVQGDWRTAIEKVERARTEHSDSGSQQGYRAANCPSA